MDLATSEIAPAVAVPCPACHLPVSLRVWPAGDGTVEYDGGTAGTAIRLHLIHGCQEGV
jgi:hypothetical protein